MWYNAYKIRIRVSFCLGEADKGYFVSYKPVDPLSYKKKEVGSVWRINNT